MAKTYLDYTFKTDTLFKILFTHYPDLLKNLVAELLGIRLDSIGEFVVTNSEIPAESFGEKFCRLDINMIVDGQRVNLELQVRDEKDYPDRVLFHWARIYSSSIAQGHDYIELPRTVIISIIDFNLFKCAEFHSEFRPLEAVRHELLSEKMSLHFFELRKLPEGVSIDDKLRLWLALFKAETEEDLQEINSLEVPVMEQAISAYRHIKVTPEFKEAERLREIARHNEAAALRHARTEGKAEGKAEGKKQSDAKWQSVVAEKDAEIARLQAQLRK